jgi:hypothetical protein
MEDATKAAEPLCSCWMEHLVSSTSAGLKLGSGLYYSKGCGRSLYSPWPLAAEFPHQSLPYFESPQRVALPCAHQSSSRPLRSLAAFAAIPGVEWGRWRSRRISFALLRSEPWHPCACFTDTDAPSPLCSPASVAAISGGAPMRPLLSKGTPGLYGGTVHGHKGNR